MKLIEQEIALPVLYTIEPSSVQARDAIMVTGSAIKSITTAGANTAAGMVVRDIRRHLRDVESVRKDLSAPLQAAAKQLKALSDDHIAPLQDEMARLEGLATAFMVGEQRRIAAEEKLKQEAFLKAQQEQFEAQDRAAKLAASVKTDAGLEKAIQAEVKADMAAAKVQDIIAQPEQFLQKARGQSLKQVMEYEVMDIKAVYAARPELCKIEISPAAVRSTCLPENPVPGLRMWWVNKSTFANR